MKATEVLPAAFGAEGRAGGGGGLRLRSLMTDVRVVVDEAVPTLQIEARRGGGHRLSIGPEFAAKWIVAGDDALACIAHEVLHAVRGHLRTPFERHPGLRSLQNLALDVLVNSCVLTWAIGGPTPGIYRRLYSSTEFPDCLLLPPADLLAAAGLGPSWRGAGLGHLRGEFGSDSASRRDLHRWCREHFARLEVRHAEAFSRAYLLGWLGFPEPAGYWELLRALFVAEFGIDPAPTTALLLGSHGPGEQAPPKGTATPSDGLTRILREQLATVEGSFQDAGPSQPSREQLDRFARQVATALDRDAGGTTRSVRTATQPTPVPLMPGRRDLPLIAMGHYPAIWHPLRAKALPERRGVRLYIDVSGSMADLCPLLFALARALGSSLDLPVWCWSLGEPAAVTSEDLLAGRYLTRCGTDVAPVIAHALEQGFGRILVLTDGAFPIGKGLVDLVASAGLDITVIVSEPMHPTLERHLRTIAGHVFALSPH